MHKEKFLIILILLFLLSLNIATACTTLTNNSDNHINTDTTVCLGTYNDTHVIFDVSDIYFDCNGSTLDGVDDTGTGIYAASKNNIQVFDPPGTFKEPIQIQHINSGHSDKIPARVASPVVVVVQAHFSAKKGFCPCIYTNSLPLIGPFLHLLRTGSIVSQAHFPVFLASAGGNSFSGAVNWSRSCCGSSWSLSFPEKKASYPARSRSPCPL